MKHDKQHVEFEKDLGNQIWNYSGELHINYYSDGETEYDREIVTPWLRIDSEDKELYDGVPTKEQLKLVEILFKEEIENYQV